jgi:hypothetical protein
MGENSKLVDDYGYTTHIKSRGEENIRKRYTRL